MRTMIAFGLVAIFVATASRAERAEPIPDGVIANWEKLIGTWITDNEAYKSESETMDAYGIVWEWGLGKKSLVGRLYGIRDGKEVGSFWEFREFWHPGEGRLITTQYGSDGTYGAGPHDVKDDGTSSMLQTFFDPTTGRVFRSGHRSMLEGDVHTTHSFDVTAEGEWQPRRTYVWRRQGNR